MALTDGARGAFTSASGRRYDLDWLRVIAFALLIFYHVGMFYVTWDWHVKSAYASDAAEPAMLLLNPWRLALLFFISGVALRFAADKTSFGALAGRRLFQLGVPILFGMIVIVAPQTYYELRQASEIEPGYLAFWLDYMRLDQRFEMITPTWNHLWYVVYLLVYTLILAPFLPVLRRLADGGAGRALGRALSHPAALLLLVPIPFIIYRFTLDVQFPTTHALVDDWANHAHRFTIFVFGFLIAKNAAFWDGVRRAFWPAIGVCVALAIALSVAWEQRDALSQSALAIYFFRVLRIIYAWSAILALLTLAQRFLNRPSKTLSYLTQAVFPYYILHQTIIVVLGYYLTQARIGAWPEFIALTSATTLLCVIGAELARRSGILRPLFGLKLRNAASFAKVSASPT